MSDRIDRQAAKAEIAQAIADYGKYYPRRVLEAAIDRVPSADVAALRSLPEAADEREPTKHVCDNRCLGDEGHHAWPSPPAARSDAAELIRRTIEAGDTETLPEFFYTLTPDQQRAIRDSRIVGQFRAILATLEAK